MTDNHDVEESVIAKSTGEQEEEDIAVKDAALYNVLNSSIVVSINNVYRDIFKSQTQFHLPKLPRRLGIRGKAINMINQHVHLIN
jgi:RNA polymerase-interacting CarD/CdnL/TRCF family regulator